jgi:hypothetical protein
MRDKIYIMLILLVTFAVTFIFVTAATDTVAKANGYYSQGIQDERDMENGY